MAKWLTLLVLLLFVLPATAVAATVKVRVEGKTRTLFGPTEVTVTASTPLEAIQQASLLGELYYHVTTTSFGPYVDQVGLYGGDASSGWVFKVDDASPPVGADQVQLKDGDTVEWYYATFGATGGPPTLVLSRVQGKCYRVVEQDDSGKTTAAVGAVIHVDGRSVETHGATGAAATCLTGKHGLVWATLNGAVRSNRLP